MFELKTDMSKETENQDKSRPLEPSAREVFSPLPQAGACCAIHPDKKAFRVCKTCGRSFCAQCLVHYYGVYYCEKCGAECPERSPVTAANPAAYASGAVPGARKVESPEEARAFKLSLISLIPPVGLVLGIIVLFLGFSAMSRSGTQPGVKTSQKALYAVLIAAGSWILQVIGCLILLANVAT
ncbi:MAG: hypothetical protein ABIH04_09165 [Planctomycetota bacterium]